MPQEDAFPFSSQKVERSPGDHSGIGKHKPRKKRSDAGKTMVTDRDQFALLWIGQQYGICLDQLQWLLGYYPGRGATHTNWISESSARDVVRRWKQSGWVYTTRLRLSESPWIWLSKKGLSRCGLTYTYHDLEKSDWRELDHLYAINEVRLHASDLETAGRWVSERQLLQRTVRAQGDDLVHRPDAILYEKNEVIAIELEISAKETMQLSEILIELVRGKEYLSWKADIGIQRAGILSQEAQSHYTQIRYYAPKQVRAKIRRVRAKLVREGILSEEEAERICVYWYPLSKTDQEQEQEEQEDDEAFERDL